MDFGPKLKTSSPGVSLNQVLIGIPKVGLRAGAGIVALLVAYVQDCGGLGQPRLPEIQTVCVFP